SVLARMPRKYSMPALVEGLASPTSAIRSGAAACLGRIGDTAAVSALEVALADAEIAVRLQARDALEALGAAVPPADVLRTPQLDVGALRRCGRRLEAFGQAIILHAAANKGRLPAEIVPLYNILAARKPGAGDSVSATKIRELGCPMAAAGSGYVYLLQGTTATLMDVKDAHTLPVMHDAPPAHHGIYNVLFLDGHVEAVTAKQLNKLLEAPEEAILGKDTLKMVPLKAFAPIAPTHVETSTAAIAALAEALDDESSPIRGAAVRSLASIGADAVPVLIKALQHSKVRVRGNAAIALALIGPDAKAAVPALIRLLQDKDWKIQIQAIKTLDAIGPQAKAAVPALVKLAGGQDVALMTEATETLARMGPEGVRALQRLAADPPVAADSRLAALVHYTLESTGNSRIGQGIVRSPDEITSNTEVAIPELIAALKDQDSTVRSKAIGALRQMGTPAKRALLQALESGDPALRRGAVEAWSSFPSSAKERLSIFVEKLQDTDATVRWKAAEGIYKLGAAARPAIADLVRALTDEHPGVQGFASLTLAKTGDAGIQALAEALESDDQRLRWAAAKGFCWAFPRTKGVLAILKERDVDTDPVYACVTGKVGPRTTKALVEALQGDDLVIRQAVVVIIARHLGPKAKAAEPALIKMVTDPDAWLRYQAVSALSHIGPDAVEAVPVLIKALDDKGDCVALAAALALGNIGPAARNAIPALKKAHANGERELRFLATKAIRKIAAPPGK
ncbi:MAG: HEAT repeat domain-containing protein, partial [Lentisphaeria bacterium]|nr:HEAT repeat domain-containing protein [Lentisphaeria bacterium]